MLWPHQESAHNHPPQPGHSLDNHLTFSLEGSQDHYDASYPERLQLSLQQLGLAGPLPAALDLLEAALLQHRQVAELGLSLFWEISPAGLLESPRQFLAQDWERGQPRLNPRLAQLTAARPEVKPDWEQLPCIPYSLQLRIEALAQLELPNLPILLLGDDDFVSLGLRWAGEKRPLSVLDIDPQVLTALQNNHLDLHHCDLRHGLPENLKGRFGCVVSDPPYALEGMRLFLDAARAALVPGGLLFLSTQPLLLGQGDQFPELLEGLTLEHSWMGLNRYVFPPQLAEEIGQRMSIYGFPPSSLPTSFVHPTCMPTPTLTDWERAARRNPASSPPPDALHKDPEQAFPDAPGRSSPGRLCRRCHSEWFRGSESRLLQRNSIQVQSCAEQTKFQTVRRT